MGCDSAMIKIAAFQCVTNTTEGGVSDDGDNNNNEYVTNFHDISFQKNNKIKQNNETLLSHL